MIRGNLFFVCCFLGNGCQPFAPSFSCPKRNNYTARCRPPRSKKETNKKHPRVGKNQLPRVFSVYYLLLASAGRNRRVRVYTISWMAQSLSARQTSQPSVQAGGTGVRGNM